MTLSYVDSDTNIPGYGSIAVSVVAGDLVIIGFNGIPTAVSGSVSGSFTKVKPWNGSGEVWAVIATGTGTETITVTGGGTYEHAWVLRGANSLPVAADISVITGTTGFGGVGTTQHRNTTNNTGVPTTEYPAMLFGAYAQRTGGITMNASTSAPTHELIVAENANQGLWVSAWVPGETPEPAFDYNATTTGNGASLTGFDVWFAHDAPFSISPVVNDDAGDQGFDEWWDELPGTSSDALDIDASLPSTLPDLSDVDDNIDTTATTDAYRDGVKWNGSAWVATNTLDGGAP